MYDNKNMIIRMVRCLMYNAAIISNLYSVFIKKQIFSSLSAYLVQIGFQTDPFFK
jgi:hypothetical protein